MSRAPGHDSGHVFDWGRYVAWLVEQHGTLASAADVLAAARGHVEEVPTIERALRRLRTRQQKDGGAWGQRCLRTFGVPGAITARLRWMGHYHSRFTDLPVPLCLDTLRAWEHPPISGSGARVWVQLGLASVALRREEPDLAREHLARVAAASPEPGARAEWALVMAFLESRARPDSTHELLRAADEAIHELPCDADRACLFARLVDQRGYELNVRARDHQSAFRLYQSIPQGGPAFARVRRNNGMGWSALKLGRPEEAVELARDSIRTAGDAGLLRLRAMSLQLLGIALGGEEGAAARSRARLIAETLDDETLRVRHQRHARARVPR